MLVAGEAEPACWSQRHTGQLGPECAAGETWVHLGQVGDNHAALPGLAQDLGVDLDGLSTGEEEGHGHTRHTSHLHVVHHKHQLVHQPLWQVCILPTVIQPFQNA